MDPVSHLLDHPRARDAFVVRVLMRAPWAIDVHDDAAMTLVVLTSGSAALVADGRTWRLEPGDLALVRGPGPYRMADDPASPSVATIVEGQRCIAPDGRPLHERMSHGLRRWGNDPDGPDSMMIASYDHVGEVGRLVTGILPRIAVLPAGSVDRGLVDLLSRELDVGALAQGTVLDRLSDVVLVSAIRAWVARQDSDAPSWALGTRDPAVAAALDAIHERPQHPWTIAGLAATALVSRATLAARFTEHVGMPPIAYLTRWRLALARDRLADRRATLAEIAGDVGYGSPYALSTAFKQHFGVSPTAYRAELDGVRELVGAGPTR